MVYFTQATIMSLCTSGPLDKGKIRQLKILCKPGKKMTI